MQPVVSPEQRRAAKRQMMEQIEQGASVQQARSHSAVSMHRATVYRLLKRVRAEGESAFTDGRHGHPIKLRGEVRTYLIETCQATPSVSSPVVQHAIQERFGLCISISQLNRVRASLGLSRNCMPREKKSSPPLLGEPEWQENAGCLLLLAAANETTLITQLCEALPTESATARPPLADSSDALRQRLLLTLLFLGAVGLQRTWDLRGYAADGLARLSGRKRAYGYRYTEAFLSQVANSGGAERLTDALARWTTQLWHPSDEAAEQPRSLTCYIDGHRKPVYTDALIPRGLVGRLSTVLGCRALVLLHDEQGHPLLVTTYRGDQHLTIGMPLIIAHYEQIVETARVSRIIVDREGMATEFLASLDEASRSVVTVLRTDQYQNLASFSQLGEFVPLLTDFQGQIVREVAPASITLPRPDHPGEVLSLRVALIRDLRRLVPVELRQEDADLPRRWDADQERTDPRWWEEGWQATAAPATAMTPKLIPIVTTADICDPVELAQTYIHRWPAQENVIKDFLLPLGLDTNHGFAKTPVENSEVARRRSNLQKRLAKLKHWAESASKRSHQAGKRHDRLRVQLKSRADELYRELGLYQTTLEFQGVADHVLRREIKERKTVIDAELEQIRVKEWRAYEQCNQEFRKQERYCKEQRDVLRALEDLEATERTMYELDQRKDQVMTVCKVALANLAMWVRDHSFPASYAHATWLRLVPFFRLPGRVMRDATNVQIELRPFNDRALNRDLALLCTGVNEVSPRFPDGRHLCFRISTTSTCHTLSAQEQPVGVTP